MFDANQFLQFPTFEVSAAARMVLIGLELDGKTGVQHDLQYNHMGVVRARIPLLTACIGGFIQSDGPYCLVVLDSILPDAYQRRTIICMDTELTDQRHRMLMAAGLIPYTKKGEQP